MHGIQCDKVEFQNCSSLISYKHILVHIGIYWYVQVHTSTTQHNTFDLAPSSLRAGLRPLRVSAVRLAWSFLAVFFSMAVSSTVRPSRPDLPRPKFHSQVLTSYTLQSRLRSKAAESAQPMGNPEPLCLLNLCGIVGVELPARNKELRGTLPKMWSTRAT